MAVETFLSAKLRIISRLHRGFPLAWLLLVVCITQAGGCSSKEAVKADRSQGSIVAHVTASEALELIQTNNGNPDFVILDVRTPEEFSDGHIENAINLDYYSARFKEELAGLVKDKVYLTYCRSGARSERTVAIMEDLDFTQVYDMTYGLNQWKAEDYPLTASP